jgi:carbon storage regulator
MLVLSRKPTESILINGNIRVTITAIKGGQVRIGIEAPSEVTVDRAEVHQRREEFADRDAEQFIEARSA